LVKTIPRQFGEPSSLTAFVHRREMVGQTAPGSEFFPFVRPTNGLTTGHS